MASATVTVPQAAEQLGVSPDTAYREIRAGRFPVPVVRIGRQLRVPTAPLERLLNTGSVDVASTSAPP
jgi:excisionase family DNA binding protein